MHAIRFALDEDVSHPLAGLLRAHGYDADSAKELGRLGLTDTQALLRATESEQVLVTANNRDFRALHEAWITWRQRWEHEVIRTWKVPAVLSRHAGIVVVPHLPNFDLAHILEQFADTADTLDDRLFAWSTEKRWHELGFSYDRTRTL